MVECVLSQIKPSEFYNLSREKSFGLWPYGWPMGSFLDLTLNVQFANLYGSSIFWNRTYHF